MTESCWKIQERAVNGCKRLSSVMTMMMIMFMTMMVMMIKNQMGWPYDSYDSLV